MVRKSGGAAAGALEQRDRNAIQKRTRTGNELTIPQVEVMPLGEFPDPPGRRFSPWTKENAGGTDIVIGSVDEKGFFQGMMLTEVHMQILLRFFKMAQTYMPRDTPAGLEGLADEMKNGMATVVVTRGTYGREVEAGNGPKSNQARPAIWETVREARIMNPNLKITCLDVPSNITGQQLSKVLEEPLSAHRELAFYEGVWYTPKMVEDAGLPKQLEEAPMLNQTKPLWHTRVNSKKESEKFFNRKKFAWRDITEPMWVKTWTQVFKDEDYVAKDKPAITRDFTGPTIHNKPTHSLADGIDGE